MQAAVNRVELRKKRMRTLVQEALEVINETNSKLRSSDNGKDKKRKQKLS